MKVKEILELSQTKPLATIAKEHLTIGKVKATEALKTAGCYCKTGVRGWFYNGDSDVLDQSIYDFVVTSQRKASSKKTKASIKATDNKSESNIQAKASQKQGSSEGMTFTSNLIASTSELDVIDKLLLQNDSSSMQRVYRGFYWDTDIIHFLDNVKHGNKSDLMNEIVRTVLRNKGLL